MYGLPTSRVGRRRFPPREAQQGGLPMQQSTHKLTRTQLALLLEPVFDEDDRPPKCRNHAFRYVLSFSEIHKVLNRASYP